MINKKYHFKILIKINYKIINFKTFYIYKYKYISDDKMFKNLTNYIQI
jgi:hypothetical protein